jgi:hypothetical protein
MIDLQNFTPWASLLGGMLIGLATLILILLNGRIAGISGILGGLIKVRPHDIGWRLSFTLGLIASPLVWRFFAMLPPVKINADFPLLVISGLLVGIGTRFGSGCTSGHGICGLSRLSPRSIVATLSFMLAGFITVYLTRHILGL